MNWRYRRVQCCVLLFAGSVLAETTLCGTGSVYTPGSKKYTFQSNEWGDDGSGSQCITIGDDNSTFEATWQWRDNESSVHAFPNIYFNSNLLPLQLSNISALTLQADWLMAPETSDSTTLDKKGLNKLDTRANVALDMFVDPDPNLANFSTNSQYEIMVWIGKSGDVYPYGAYGAGYQAIYRLDGVKYKLYNGTNQNNRTVLSWMAEDDLPRYTQDVTPLIVYLWSAGYLPETNYLQSCQFGSEEFHATSNVTFSMWDFKITLESGSPTASSIAAANLTEVEKASKSTSNPDGVISGPGYDSGSSVVLISGLLGLLVIFAASIVTSA